MSSSDSDTEVIGRAMTTFDFPHCSMCNRAATKLCARCSSSRYCSQECQKADWPTHKLLCESFKDFATPPKGYFKRAILFPADSENPKFIWVDSHWEMHDGGKELLSAKDEPRDSGCWLGFRDNKIRLRRLKHVIVIAARSMFISDGLATNASILKATNGLMDYPWNGAVVVYGDRYTVSNPIHLDMMDFRDIVDYFMWYGREQGKATPKAGIRSVTGVKIACKGDLAVFGAKKFQTVQVPRQHPVFAAPSCHIPSLIGLPISVRRLPPHSAWRSGNEISTAFMNPQATYLHLNADKDSDEWGWAPMSSQNSVGTVLVVRRDGKDLSPLHMEALCEFCQFEVGEAFEDQMEAEKDRDTVLPKLTPAKFAEFFEAYRSRKAESLLEWRTVASPYDV